MVYATESGKCPYCGISFSAGADLWREHLNKCKVEAEEKAVREYKPENHGWMKAEGGKDEG